MSKFSYILRAFFALVTMAGAIAVAGSVTLIVASDAILQTEFLKGTPASYLIWAGVSYLALIFVMVGAYRDHFTERLNPDPNLASLEELFED